MEHISRRSALGLGAAALVPLVVPSAPTKTTPTWSHAATGGAAAVLDDHREPLTPYLVIPYTDTDTGSRPLPPTVTFWKCQSVHVNGVPYDGTHLPPGVPVQLSAMVANLGGLATSATVRFYWADPATAFTAANTNLISSQVLWLPANTTLESPPISFTPGAAQPEHFCLFAEATSPGDFAPGTFDPIGDRHYAQQNLRRLPAVAGQLLIAPFFAVGTKAATAYRIELFQVRDPRNTLVIPSDNVRLVDHETGAVAPSTLELQLRPDQRRSLEIQITVPTDARRGGITEFVVTQNSVETSAVTGAIGIGLYVT